MEFFLSFYLLVDKHCFQFTPWLIDNSKCVTFGILRTIKHLRRRLCTVDLVNTNCGPTFLTFTASLSSYACHVAPPLLWHKVYVSQYDEISPRKRPFVATAETVFTWYRSAWSHCSPVVVPGFHAKFNQLLSVYRKYTMHSSVYSLQTPWRRNLARFLADTSR